MDREHFLAKLLTSFAITGMLVVSAVPTSAGPPEPGQEPPQEALSRTSGDDETPKMRYIPGEILVKFKPTVSRLGAQNLLAARGLQVADAIHSIGVLKVAVKSGREQETIAALRENANVLYAEPNHVAFAFDAVPNDPYFGSQWGLSRIEAPAAWGITTGGSNVVIAVVDTGIDLDHPDFSCPGKLVAGYDFYNNDSTPEDDHGHGSHAAGIAAACTNNSTGVAGMAWGARLMPIKSLNGSGNGSYFGVAQGITYAVDNGADIINLSLGGFDDDATLAGAIQYAVNNGVLVIASAGNCAQDGYQCNYLYNPVMYPGAYPTTLAVAATDAADNWAIFSEHHPYVDVAAPGLSIYSTVIGGYGYKSGTSMSAPYVAGLAALIWSLTPGLTHDQVQDIIQSTADDLGDPGKDDYFGHGRINAWSALDALVGLQTSPDQTSFLIDGDSGPFPATVAVQVSTTSSEPITWTASVSPPVAWLEIAPPSFGMVSAASSDSFTLVVPTHPLTYGTYTTTVIVTGTTGSGGTVGPATTEVRISYVPELHQYKFPIVLKSATH